MGVGPNKVYFLEQCGYNNKDFRIPDNDGYICKNEKICPDYKLDQPIDTKINLQWLSEELRKKGHKIDLSKDPGRYLCNYIYFNSLQKVCGDHCTSLFVHFPDLEYTTNEQNVKFVTDLINVLTAKKWDDFYPTKLCIQIIYQESIANQIQRISSPVFEYN